MQVDSYKNMQQRLPENIDLSDDEDQEVVLVHDMNNHQTIDNDMESGYYEEDDQD